MIQDLHGHGGDEAYTTTQFSPDARMDKGDYLGFLTSNNAQTPFQRNQNFVSKGGGIWPGSWSGIRKANYGLLHFNDLVNATQEEKDLIQGQLLFFRAYFHHYLMIHNYQESFLRKCQKTQTKLMSLSLVCKNIQ